MKAEKGAVLKSYKKGLMQDLFPKMNDDVLNAHRPENDGRKNDHPIKNKYGLHNRKYGATIGDVVNWFKTMTTNEYIRGVKINNWQRFDGNLWQRNYYDYIIRNWVEYTRISNYIIENPAKWNIDKFNG